MQDNKLLLELICREQKKYPVSLKSKDIVKIMNCCRTQGYELLEGGDIPGARKIPGLGWRINRDVFLTWLYGREGK
jgi:hypothetical protein